MSTPRRYELSDFDGRSFNPSDLPVFTRRYVAFQVERCCDLS
jgi:hypothetical protein